MNIRNDFQTWINHPRRKASVECDYGANWRRSEGWSSWRISWIEATGELYAVCFDRTPPKNFVFIGRFATEAEADQAMASWAEAKSDLEAIITQVQGGPPAPRWEPKAEEEDPLPDLSGVSFKPLDVNTLNLPRDVKAYIGQRTTDEGECRVFVSLNGRIRNLRHVVRHSPTGYEWGYAGSGPADLALSILADYFGDRPRKFNTEQYEKYRSLRIYQDFKRGFVSDFPKGGFVLLATQIMEWLNAHDDKFQP